MKLRVAIPALDELDRLPLCLEALAAQELSGFETWICVNQPEEWWQDPGKRPVCERNRKTLEWIEGYGKIPIRAIDRSSPGRGWAPGKGGAGRARREIMDGMVAEGADGDIIVSLDADTLFDPGYLGAILDSFERFPEAAGISAPYFHPLTGDEALDRAILRYECYLRHYAINLWRIGSPYSFTALGSAMAFPIRSYRRVRGMPLKNGGEDFYFLQKLCKTGRLIHWCDSRVRPAARFSDRVAFGTGPALRKGSWSDWSAYPIFSSEIYDEIEETVRLFPELLERNISTPVTAFLGKALRTDDPWAPLRRNHRDPERFVRACHERLDGLRIFQYLRFRQREMGKMAGSDEERLLDCLRRHYPGSIAREISAFSFERSPVPEIDALRRVLQEIENGYRRGDL